MVTGNGVGIRFLPEKKFGETKGSEELWILFTEHLDIIAVLFLYVNFFLYGHKGVRSKPNNFSSLGIWCSKQLLFLPSYNKSNHTAKTTCHLSSDR